MSQAFSGNRSYNFTFNRLLVFTDYSLVTVVQYEQVAAAKGTLLGPEMDYSEPNFVTTKGLLTFCTTWLVGRQGSELLLRVVEKQINKINPELWCLLLGHNNVNSVVPLLSSGVFCHTKVTSWSTAFCMF